jgi:protein TonB
MNVLNTRIAVLAVASLLASPAVSAQDENKDKAADLDAYSVGDRRPAVEPEKVTIERPSIQNDFKLDIPKPSMTGIQMARPTFQVMSEPDAVPAEQNPPTRTADSGGATPAVHPAVPGGETRAVRPLRMDPPEYPRDAFRRRQEGYVVMEFTINTQGGTEDISIVEAQPRGAFDMEARRAVARWTFEPALRDGRSVPQRIRHTLEFSLDGR